MYTYTHTHTYRKPYMHQVKQNPRKDILLNGKDLMKKGTEQFAQYATIYVRRKNIYTLIHL